MALRGKSNSSQTAVKARQSPNRVILSRNRVTGSKSSTLLECFLECRRKSKKCYLCHQMTPTLHVITFSALNFMVVQCDYTASADAYARPFSGTMVTIKVAVGFIPGKSKFGMLCWINVLTITPAIYKERIAHIIERFEQKFACFIFYSRHVNAAITLWCHFAKIEKKKFFSIPRVSYTPTLPISIVFMTRRPF